MIEKCDTYIIDFQGEPIVTKFEFLKALAIARVYGFKEYEKALTFIKLNYSSTIEGKEARSLFIFFIYFNFIKLDLKFLLLKDFITSSLFSIM